MVKRYLAGLIMFTSMSFGLAVCGPSATGFCDAACDCKGCSDREYDDCLRDYDYADGQADRLGCYDLFSDYADCVASGEGCRDRDYDEYCKPERDRYRGCVHDDGDFGGI
jgi:hypothetical protein